MNDSECSIFRELSVSVGYHVITGFKGILCSLGALRIAMQWNQYGVRFLVHENTKVMFRIFFALSIINSSIFATMHLFELVRLRFDCFLLDFRYILLTRGMAISSLYAGLHVMLMLSFERLYSALFPAHFERNSSKRLSLLIALSTVAGTYAYAMMCLSDNFRLFHEQNFEFAFLTVDIPKNHMRKLMSRIALSNGISLITLCIDSYLTFFRETTNTSSLSVSYQRSENRRILLTLLPIELTQAGLGAFTSLGMMVYGQLVSNSTPVEKQVFMELVTLALYFPFILTFIIKHSAESHSNRAPPSDPEVDQIAILRTSWNV